MGSVRLSALSKFGVVYIMTHDSIGLGEDGPTHQPVEMLESLRATPNLLTLRPADGNEVVGCYVAAMENAGTPSVLSLSRHACPILEGSSAGKFRVLSLEELRAMEAMGLYFILVYWWCLFIWIGALDSSGFLLSYPLMPLASPMTNILISPLKYTHIIYTYIYGSIYSLMNMHIYNLYAYREDRHGCICPKGPRLA